MPTTESPYTVRSISCEHCRVAVAEHVGQVAGVASAEVRR